MNCEILLSVCFNIVIGQVLRQEVTVEEGTEKGVSRTLSFKMTQPREKWLKRRTTIKVRVSCPVYGRGSFCFFVVDESVFLSIEDSFLSFHSLLVHNCLLLFFVKQKQHEKCLQ